MRQQCLCKSCPRGGGDVASCRYSWEFWYSCQFLGHLWIPTQSQIFVQNSPNQWEIISFLLWGLFHLSESESHSILSNSLWPHELYSPWNYSGQNTGVGSCPLLQGIFPTHGSSPSLLHCRQILYQLSHRRSPRILERVAYLFSSRASGPRNQIGVSCLAGRFFTSWATREALIPLNEMLT